MMAANPARRFGLYGQKGALQPGFDADFILVDLDKEWTCHARYKTTKSAKGGER